MHFGGLYEDEIVGKAYDRRLLGRFLRYVRPYTVQAVAALALLPFMAAARLAQPWLLKLAIDEHIVAGRLEGLPLVAAGYLGLILLESCATYAEVWLLQQIGQQVMFDLRQELFAHLQRLPASFFDRTPSGGLVTRLTSDVEALGEMFAAGIITIVGDILVLAGIVGIMLAMNPSLSLATFTVLPLLVWVAFSFRQRMRSAYRQVRSQLANLNSFLAESIAGMSTVQLCGRETDQRREFTRLNAAYREANLPVIAWDASLFALVETLGAVAVGIIIWYGGNQVLQGGLSFGALVAFIQYIEKFFAPIRDLSGKYSVMQGAMASLERIFTLLDTPAGAGTEETAPLPATLPPFREIEFRDVWFAYQGEEYVLKGFNLTIRRGESIALVGETGGGKTTVTRLLARLYEINHGAILLDGTDIRQIPLRELRRRVGVVLQEPFLFTGTVRFNVTLDEPRAAARLGTALQAVGADRLVARLPGGLDAELREKGHNLSAGERQLLSFARAVAFDPEILVLDEATAAVDSESERLIQQGLSGLLAGRTSLVVAHRLSTVRDADRIVVIRHGEKVEEGNHATLLAAGGLYARLYQLQFKE